MHGEGQTGVRRYPTAALVEVVGPMRSVLAFLAVYSSVISVDAHSLYRGHSFEDVLGG